MGLEESMIQKSVIQELAGIVGSEKLRLEESMAKHTTFRIGGPAEYYIEVSEEEELKQLLAWCSENDFPYFILGNGSNLLVSDKGWQGLMISMKGFDEIRFQENEDASGRIVVTAGSGVLLSKLATQVAARGLDGFAFAAGIPGTLGGAVTMNAGAYGGEIKDVILHAKVMLPDGRIQTLSAEELKLSYRHSIIQEEDMIVLEATFAFAPGDAEGIQAYIRELNEKRREKQPLEYGSAGSTFKRPEGYFAGKLVQDAGLRGYRVGDVMVSEKHCGFVVNVGQGTCEQAMKVIGHVQEQVKRQFGVELELEVKRLG